MNARHLFYCAFILIMLLVPRSSAHDSPEHVVDELTEQMSAEGRTPLLLVRRAYEYQALGKYAEAESDLRDAITIDAQYAEAYARLARVYTAQDKHDTALEVLAQGLEHAESEVDTVDLLQIRAKLREATGDYADALTDCDTVLEYRPKELEPLLQKSHLLARMGEMDARVDWLRDATRRNSSIVLDIELTDALIDAMHYEEADRRVVIAASNKRWLSAWRIRRARIHLGLKEHELAEMELTRALEEIAGRRATGNADPVLLLEQATAHALLGETEAARTALAEARTSGVSPWELWQVSRWISGE